MDLADFTWKDFFGAFGALVGVISALITAIGSMAAYKLKKAERSAVTGTPVKILSLKEQRSFNGTLLTIKIAGYGMIIFAPVFIVFFIWSFGFDATWVATLGAGYVVTTALYVFILWKLRGDISQRRSRTRHDTTRQ